MTCGSTEVSSNWHRDDLTLPILKQASKLLKCPEEELQIFDPPLLSHLKDGKLTDRAIASDGIKPGLPMVADRGLHKYNRYGKSGVVLYETRTNPPIQYVYGTFLDDQSTSVDRLIAKTGTIFRLYRYFKRCQVQDNIEDAPVLAEGLIEELLKQTIQFLIASEEIEQYGVRVRRGVLFHGTPGNGKTMACQWIRKLCDDHNISWTRITAGQIIDAFAKSKLDDLVSGAEVTFYDDIDMSFLCRRNSESAKISCALLAALDGVSTSSHVVRIFTTNEIVSTIDDAFLRPGRIDKIFLFGHPTKKMRQELIERWPKEMTDAVGLQNIVESTRELSFAETEAIRTMLVTRYLFEGSVWDLRGAMADYKAYTGTKKVTNAGFESEAS